MKPRSFHRTGREYKVVYLDIFKCDKVVYLFIFKGDKVVYLVIFKGDSLAALCPLERPMGAIVHLVEPVVRAREPATFS